MVSNKELRKAFLDFLNIFKVYTKEIFSESLVKIDSILPTNFDYYLALKIIIFICVLILLVICAAYAIHRERKKKFMEMMFMLMAEENKKKIIVTEINNKEHNDWCDISLN